MKARGLGACIMYVWDVCVCTVYVCVRRKNPKRDYRTESLVIPKVLKEGEEERRTNERWYPKNPAMQCNAMQNKNPTSK